jgi:uncharacterized DUF497 family protein
MDRLNFDWDPQKARVNRIKHGITFEEAVSVFADEAAPSIPDPDPSTDEERFVLLGLSARLRVLVVVHCDWEAEATIRIISARKATRAERSQYVERDLRCATPMTSARPDGTPTRGGSSGPSRSGWRR